MRKIVAALLFGIGLLAAPAAHADQPVNSCAGNVSHTGSACEITPAGVSTAAENGHVIKAAPGVLVGFQVNNWSTSTGLTVMALDATTVPSNGTLSVCSYTNGTPNVSPCIMKWYGIAQATSSGQPTPLGANWAPGPFLHFSNGLVLVCSSTGPTTLTLSANCTFSAEVN